MTTVNHDTGLPSTRFGSIDDRHPLLDQLLEFNNDVLLIIVGFLDAGWCQPPLTEFFNSMECLHQFIVLSRLIC